MTKLAEQKALEAYPNALIGNLDNLKKDGYIKGYDQAMQDFMEKTEIWLEIHMPYGEVPRELVYDCIQEFKNYMQNEM